MAAFDLADPDDPEALTRLYEAAYADLKADREARVAQWRWASKQMYDPRPFETLMKGKPGRWLRQKKKGFDAYEYGLGPAGEFLIERTYIGTGGLYRERFYFADEARVVGFSYPHFPKDLDWVSVTRFADGRVLSHSRYARDGRVGRLEERYHYEDGLLRRCECREARFGDLWEYVVRFSYDAEGQLTRIESKHPGGLKVLYEKSHG